MRERHRASERFTGVVATAAVGAALLGLAFLVAARLGGPTSSTIETTVHTVVHQQVRLRLDPDQRRLSAQARVRVEGVDDIQFGLAPGYEVSELRVNGAQVPGGTENLWHLQLGGEPAEIQLHYTGELPSLAQAQAGEARVFLDPAGGFLPRDAGWYPHFPEGTRYRFDLVVDTPAEQHAVALGKRESDTHAGRRTTRFEMLEPVLGVNLITGPYRVQSLDAADGVQVRTYFTADLAPELADTYLRETARYLAHYSERIGAYPHDSFAVVAAPLPVGYGFAGMTYMGAEVLRLPFIPHTSLPHEVLHSWWGNGVYIDYDSGNWAEGLTTFMADYGLVEARDAAAAREMRAAWLRDYAALPAQRDKPLAEFVARSDQASQLIGYHKAAMVFYMLRMRVGTPAFDEALRHFWQAQRDQYAGWDELRGVFEAASGQDLGAFFAHWLARPGAPRLALDLAHQDGQLTLALRQAGGQGDDAYPLQVPIELAWVDARGEPQRERRVVALEGPLRRVVLEAPAARGTLTVDPDYELFRHLWPEEIPPTVRAVTLTRAPARQVLASAAEAAAVARAAEAISPDAVAVDAVTADTPGLIIGTRAHLEALLRARAWSRPDAVRGRGQARAWMDPAAPARLFVEGDDLESLAALARVLRHYGNQSYVVWEDGRVAERGVWSATDSRLRAQWP